MGGLGAEDGSCLFCHMGLGGDIGGFDLKVELPYRKTTSLKYLGSKRFKDSLY